MIASGRRGRLCEYRSGCRGAALVRRSCRRTTSTVTVAPANPSSEGCDSSTRVWACGLRVGRVEGLIPILVWRSALSVELKAGHRVDGSWVAIHGAVPGVARWERVVAMGMPLTTLPSGLWRIAAFTFHAPIVRGAGGVLGPSGVPGVPLGVYVVLLSLFCELLAFLAVGLIASWGEVLPRWLPGLGGRTVPRLAAVVPAGLGAAALTLLWTWIGVAIILGRRIDGSPNPRLLPISLDGWKGVLATAAYAPLLLWGPLLGLLTISYWRRRRTV